MQVVRLFKIIFAFKKFNLMFAFAFAIENVSIKGSPFNVFLMRRSPFLKIRPHQLITPLETE